jgi:cell division protein FtsB
MDRGIVLWVTASLLVIALAYVTVFAPSGLLKRREVRDAIAVQERRNTALGEKIDEARGRIARLRRSSEEIERTARDLGYARPGETVFIIETPASVEPAPVLPARATPPGAQSALIVVMVAAAVAGAYFVRKAVVAA